MHWMNRKTKGCQKNTIDHFRKILSDTTVCIDRLGYGYNISQINIKRYTSSIVLFTSEFKIVFDTVQKMSYLLLLLGNIIYFSIFEQNILYTYITYEEKLVVPESSDHENIVETKHYLPSFSWNMSVLGGDFFTTSANHIWNKTTLFCLKPVPPGQLLI